MRKIIILILAFLPFWSLAQIEIKDGIYYSEDGETYTGFYSEYFDNGNIKIKTELKNGQPDGITTLFYKTGVKKEVRSYNMGKMHGQWISFFDNEKKSAIALYEKGVKHGEWKVWDKNGVLRYIMNYEQGKKKGLWKMFDEKGDLINEKDY